MGEQSIRGKRDICSLCDISELEGLRETILFYFILAGLVTVPFFGILRNYFLGKTVIAVAALISEFILIVAYFFYSKKKIAISKLMFLTAIGVMLVSLIFQNVKFMYMWFALFPAVAFMLFPAETGLIFSVIFGLIVFIADFFIHSSSNREVYFLQEMVVFYLFMIAGGFLYAKILERQKILLSWLVSEDSLTGVMTRRRFLELLDIEIPKAKRYQIPISAVIFDIDRFRELNKSHGSEAGNRMLKDIVEVIKENIRRADVVVRWGGDEFIVYLPFTDLKGAWSVAMKLKNAVDKVISNYAVEGISVSMGLAEFKGNKDKEEFIRRLEEALYIAKNKGGNVIESV
ncbi:GGDEF domain-containing protein [Desulfurobacterium atlanticum]|uniref:diguanylate cyclase n=1 Tax=Desulfurobacterium atlanticum TaxID=240169 RepID=A0A239A7G1_9BACT|nr:GGDEF domain-containing protein [Desulfurobacterium atlanticum]SNR91500.1 diguanylate cyclase (GGDEF) domain-containing protein [Desulfurobacterium atlanticum]